MRIYIIVGIVVLQNLRVKLFQIMYTKQTKQSKLTELNFILGFFLFSVSYVWISTTIFKILCIIIFIKHIIWYLLFDYNVELLRYHCCIFYSERPQLSDNAMHQLLLVHYIGVYWNSTVYTQAIHYHHNVVNYWSFTSKTSTRDGSRMTCKWRLTKLKCNNYKAINRRPTTYS